MASPRSLLMAKGLFPKKQWGQNFLSDSSIAEETIRRANLSAKDVVLEIGAGLGALTIPAAEIVEKVYAIEKDQKIAEILKTQLLTHGLSNVEVIENDILKMDIKKIAETCPSKLIVLGNLPYNISSQILVKLITSRSHIDRTILMFQKELADRLTAHPGGKDYGRLTVMLSYCTDVKTLLTIEASAFFPKPKVDSEILDIRFKDILEYPADNESFLFSVIKAAFGKRRKTLKNALTMSELPINSEQAEQVLKETGIDPKRRAETLSVEEFVRLSNALKSYSPPHPYQIQ